jgi:hypothetical protein
MNRQCAECGCVWTPACPKWAAMVSVGVGIAMEVVAAGLVGLRFVYPHASFELGGIVWMLVAFAGFGAAAGSYGWMVLRGKAGGLVVMQKGRLAAVRTEMNR